MPTTPLDAGILSSCHPPLSSHSSSIILRNKNILPITSIGDLVLLGPFHLDIIIVALHIIHSILFVHQFTTNNSCSIEVYPFSLSMKDLATRKLLAL